LGHYYSFSVVVEDDESHKNPQQGLQNALAAVADEARVVYPVPGVNRGRRVDKEFKGAKATKGTKGNKETREIKEKEEIQAREVSPGEMEWMALRVLAGSVVQ
jgi:hypothetical protein